MTQNPENEKQEEKDPPPEHTPSTDGSTPKPGETAPAPTHGETNSADATNGSTPQAQVNISEGSLQDHSHAACPETLGPGDLNDKVTAAELATTALNNETQIAMAEMQEATINHLNNEVHQLKNEVNDLKAKNQSLATTALNNKTRPAKAEMQEASITRLNKEVDKLKREVSDLTAKNQRLLVGTADALDKFEKAQSDNESLRAQILGMLRPPGPVHDDGHYRQQLDLLNERIQGWVAAAFKAPSREPLPESSVHALNEFLSRYEYGRSLLAAMAESNHTINNFYERPIRRIALVRYIMALILWQDIFSPYCFGISVELNEVMLKVLDSVYCDEPVFSQVLMNRQAFGKGIVQQMGATQQEAKQAIVSELERVLMYLLPAPQAVRSHIEGLIDTAVTLANSMTEEQGWFRCKFIRTKRPFKEGHMYVPDDRQTGRVYLCTFPYFDKIVATDQKRCSEIIVNASVELESEFK